MTKNRKDLIIVVLATFCLTAMLFMIRASWSDWDPWVDIKEDGTVDIYDAITLANAYGTSGDTTKNVNVTNWPDYQSKTIIVANNMTITFQVQDVFIRSVDVTGYRHVSLFIYHYTDGNVDLRLYPKCSGIQYNDYTIVSMHTSGTWYTAGLMAYEVSSPIIDFTVHAYSATYIYLTLVLYCYN